MKHSQKRFSRKTNSLMSKQISHCQMPFIDMQTKQDCKYKYVLVYQKH